MEQHDIVFYILTIRMALSKNNATKNTMNKNKDECMKRIQLSTVFPVS